MVHFVCGDRGLVAYDVSMWKLTFSCKAVHVELTFSCSGACTLKVNLYKLLV